MRRAAADFVRAFADHAGWRGLRAVALVAAGALLEGVSVILLIPILGVVVPGGAEGWRGWLNEPLRAIGAVTALQQLAVLLGAFLLVAILRAALLYARDVRLAELQSGFVEALRNRALGTLAAAPWSRIVALRHARLTNLLGSEMQRVAGSAQFLIQGSVAAVLLAVQGALALSLAPGFALPVLLVLALGAFLVFRGHRRSHDLGKDVLREAQEMMASASGLLGGLKAAAAQNGQGHFLREFAMIQTQLRRHGLAFQRRQARARGAFGLGSAMAGAALVFGGVAYGIAAPVLIALILIFARMSGPAQQIQTATQQFFFGLPSFEGIRQLEADLADGTPAVTPIAPLPGPIELRDARYLHPGGGGVAQASLAIAPGSFVGISGPSGAGKTTLVDLLIGLIAPQAGEMRVGGVALDAQRRAGWRDGVAYVPQDGFLFHDSVRRNLCWDGAADDAALARAVALAGAGPLIERLDHGLETVVGERGALLSGGERQRIALARALVRPCRLLVLDEAANAIDAAGEAALLARLAALDPRPTILMVSHRADSMALCDHVIRVESGVVTCAQSPRQP
ncbi:ABC transporter ATP-binding protein [Sphingomonas sp. PB4P5]|uniref:ABC transporter ATP-binding protein n=1 Tax=Parasphingomonas puruogangriensis TaxID=3096155 RepID=UPI002FCA2B4C